jgi:type VI protein secretion system component VasK
MQGTKAEWQRIFYIGAAILLAGILVFVMFASGEVQEWAKELQQEDEETKDQLVEADKEENKKANREVYTLMDQKCVENGNDTLR